MAFLNPVFLLGAIAAGVPILVHLVRRTRAPRIQFPSLMFLRKIEQKTIRRRKLRNLLLLMMRCAALLLLALAFARPFFTGATPVSASGDHNSTVILVDGSYSMRYGDVFNRARQSARNMINDAASDEHLAVVLFSKSYQVLMPLKADRSEATGAVNEMQPGFDSTDYLQGIQAADAILKDAGRGLHRIYLISDFQDSGWNRAAPPVKLSADVTLFPIDVSASKYPKARIARRLKSAAITSRSTTSTSSQSSAKTRVECWRSTPPREDAARVSSWDKRWLPEKTINTSLRLRARAPRVRRSSTHRAW